jgi:preprotein translocase subunit SecE
VNRQTKRLLQRQGQLAADGTPATVRRGSSSGGPAGPTRRAPEQRASLGTRFVEYMRDVRAELAKVLWPHRAEVVNYSTVVLTTLIFLALMIFGLNFIFAKGVMFLFKS